MVGSRHLQGTIISRVKYLLESGSLKTTPLWYGIVRRFPPSTSLLSSIGECDTSEITKITYPEDDVKCEFYKDHFRAARDPESSFNDIKTAETKTAMFLNEYYQFLNAGHSSEKALNDALVNFKDYMVSLQEKTQDRPTDSSNLLEIGPSEEEKVGDLQANDIYKIFSSSANKFRKAT